MEPSATPRLECISQSSSLERRENLGSVSVHTEKVICTWTILDCNKWCHRMVDVRSPTFMNSVSTKCCMILHAEYRKFFLRFSLFSSEKGPMVECSVKASLISGNGNKYEVCPTTAISLNGAKETNWIPLADFFNKDNDLWNMFRIEGEVNISSIITEPLVSIALNQQLQSVTDDLEALLNSGDLSDVVLSTGDTELKAHRLLLSARSPVFAAMLRHDTREAQTGRIHIEDVDPDTLREVLHYIYTGRVPHIKKITVRLLMAADKYDLQKLKELCEMELGRNLTIDNSVDTAIIALSHSCDMLKPCVITFFKRNLLHILGTDKWAEAVTQHPATIVELSRLLADKSVLRTKAAE